jgi:hypothetical protein
LNHNQQRQSLLVRLATLAWAHFESVERDGEIHRRAWGVQPPVCVTSSGYEWGFGATREDAVAAFAKRVLARSWVEQRYELEVRMAKPSRTGDYLTEDVIKSMLEGAWCKYVDWHQNDDLDGVWHGADLSELTELIGDVVDGYCMARGHEWSHPLVPDGCVIEYVIVEIDGEQKSWNIIEMKDND